MWLKANPRKFEALYVTKDGREYRFSLTQMGLAEDPPPLVVYDFDDLVQAGSDGPLFSDLHEFANFYGCVMGPLMSVDPVN